LLTRAAQKRNQPLPSRANEAIFARLDKLKHVPQCAARKLSAVSFQRSAFSFESALSQNGMSALRHEIVAACKEYRG
jgi:hypothetical protein